MASRAKSEPMPSIGKTMRQGGGTVGGPKGDMPSIPGTMRQGKKKTVGDAGPMPSIAKTMRQGGKTVKARQPKRQK